MKKTKRIKEIEVIEFDDGTKIDSSVIRKFLYDEAYEFEDTIDATGNFTEEYLYFPTQEEKVLEQVLLKLNVIRKSPNHAYQNDRVGKDKHTKDYYYWLSDGYHKFCEDFRNIYT